MAQIYQNGGSACCAIVVLLFIGKESPRQEPKHASALIISGESDISQAGPADAGPTGYGESTLPRRFVIS